MPSLASLALEATLRQAQTCVDQCLRNWKIGFAAMLFFEAILFGHVVYGLKRVTASSSQRFSYVFHLGHALSGGIFFAAGALHILPEAIALFNGGHGEHHDDEDQEEGEERWLTFRQEEEPLSEDSHSENFPWPFLILVLSFYALFFLEKLLLPKALASKSVQTDEESGELDSEPLDSELLAQKGVSDQPKGFASREFAQGLIEILGISAHSLFESIVLGLSGSFSTVLNIFIATAAHRWATSAALGFKILKSLHYIPFLVLLLLFSAIAPLGVGIGAALGSVSRTVQGVLFAISAGTFIYIGVYEIMAEEFVEHRKWLMTKFLMTMIGASIMIVVTVILHVLDIQHAHD